MRFVGIALTLAMTWALTCVAFADSPPSAEPERVFSTNRRFSALFDSTRRVLTVYRETASPRKLWEMSVQSGHVLVSNDGLHVVSYYRGGNLLEKPHAADEIMFSFYERDRLISQVHLNELIREQDLVATDSHVIWARSFGFINARVFRVETADGRVKEFDARTGARKE